MDDTERDELYQLIGEQQHRIKQLEGALQILGARVARAEGATAPQPPQDAQPGEATIVPITANRAARRSAGRARPS